MNEPEDELEASRAPLIAHLAELRSRIIWSLLAFVIAMLACFTVAEPILQFIAEPIGAVLKARGEDPRLIFTAPQEKFFVLVRISVMGGIAIAFPVIAYQMWRFVAPGLYRTEQRAFLPFILASPLLFLAGASFAHYIVTPMAMRFFISFSDAIPALIEVVSGQNATVIEAPEDGALQTVFLGSVRESLDLSLKFILAFGLCFQLPVLMTLLGMAGLVSAEALRATRRYAVVGILFLAAVLTPPDVISQIILFVVVYGLYELSIQLVRMVEAKREAALDEL